MVRAQPLLLDLSAYCAWKGLNKPTEAEVTFALKYHFQTLHHIYLIIVMNLWNFYQTLKQLVSMVTGYMALSKGKTDIFT